MKTLHMMIGLPRSGKSTKAKALGFPIVETDSIRLVIHGTAWRVEAEPLVWATAKIMVESLFLAGHDDVILDATNHTLKRREEWSSEKWQMKYYVIDTPQEICIDRANRDGKFALVPVIKRMANDFEPIGGNTDC
jgi:predicted kinase